MAAWQASRSLWALGPYGETSRDPQITSGVSQGAQEGGAPPAARPPAARGGNRWVAVWGTLCFRCEGAVGSDVEGETGGPQPQLTSQSPPLECVSPDPFPWVPFLCGSGCHSPPAVPERGLGPSPTPTAALCLEKSSLPGLVHCPSCLDGTLL